MQAYVLKFAMHDVASVRDELSRAAASLAMARCDASATGYALESAGARIGELVSRVDELPQAAVPRAADERPGGGDAPGRG